MNAHSQCPHCGKPVYSSLKDVSLTSGYSPVVALTIRVEGFWCSTPNCFQWVRVLNFNDTQRLTFIDEVLHSRDSLVPISSGQIERGRALTQYDLSKGFRKTNMKDAREIAIRVINRLNVAVNKFTTFGD